MAAADQTKAVTAEDGRNIKNIQIKYLFWLKSIAGFKRAARAASAAPVRPRNNLMSTFLWLSETMVENNAFAPLIPEQTSAQKIKPLRAEMKTMSHLAKATAVPYMACLAIN